MQVSNFLSRGNSANVDCWFHSIHVWSVGGQRNQQNSRWALGNISSHTGAYMHTSCCMYVWCVKNFLKLQIIPTYVQLWCKRPISCIGLSTECPFYQGVLFRDFYYIAKEEVGVLHSPCILNPLPLMRLPKALMDELAQEKHHTCSFQYPLPYAIDYFQQRWRG